MWASTAQFGRTLLGAPTMANYVQVWDGDTQIGVLAFTAGSVKDEWTSGTRRSLSITVPPTRVVRDMIYPGVELRPFSGLDYGGYPEVAPMGCYPLNADQFSIRADPVNLSCNDRWQWVVDAPFPAPTASNPRLTAVQQMVALLVETGRWNADQITVQTSSAVRVGAQTWEQDRSAALIELAGTIGCEVFIDRLGNPVIRDRPTGGAPLVTIAAPKTLTLPDGTTQLVPGRLKDLSALRSTADVYSAVIGVSTSSDPAVPTITYTARIADPAHPAFSPFGVVPRTFRMAVTGMSAAALKVAVQKKLTKLSAAARQLQIVCAVTDPTLDASDTIGAVWPDTGDVEVAQIQTVEHALTLQGADSQPIGTVANRTDEDLQ